MSSKCEDNAWAQEAVREWHQYCSIKLTRTPLTAGKRRRNRLCYPHPVFSGPHSRQKDWQGATCDVTSRFRGMKFPSAVSSNNFRSFATKIRKGTDKKG